MPLAGVPCSLFVLQPAGCEQRMVVLKKKLIDLANTQTPVSTRGPRGRIWDLTQQQGLSHPWNRTPPEHKHQCGLFPTV